MLWAGKRGQGRERQMAAGSFGWLELITDDVEGAIAFYTELLGWEITTGDVDGDEYRYATVGETNICGFDTDDGSGAPPHFLPYIEVDESLETSVAAVENNGGKLHRTLDVPGIGRMATCADPDGALFAALQQAEGSTSNPSVWPPADGTVSWYALAASDARKAAGFYSAVFGYDAEDSDQVGSPEGYLVLKTGEEMHAGLFGHGGTMPSTWLVYFVVPDIDAAQRKVVETGGTVLTPVMNIPGIGRIVSIADPQGAICCLHQAE
jgi:predicted enzyme related to lactoylglutathione lyase